MTSFSFLLAKSGGDLRRRDRICRKGNQRLSLEQCRDAFGLRALKSDFGKAVLRDFDGAPAARIFDLRSFICATVIPA